MNEICKFERQCKHKKTTCRYIHPPGVPTTIRHIDLKNEEVNAKVITSGRFIGISKRNAKVVTRGIVISKRTYYS